MAKRVTSGDRRKAIGYVRVSTGKQVEEGGSLEEQRAALAFYAASSNLDLVDICEDAGISGSKDETKRPGLAAAIEAVRTGKAHVLLVRDLSRLVRGLDLTGYMRVTVQKAGGVVRVMGESEDKIYRLFDAVKNEMQRTAISDRMRLWASSRQAKGLPMGKAPYGFVLGPGGRLEPVAAEKRIVARILAMKAQGASLRAIAEALNADHVPGPTSAPWNLMTVSNIVKRSGGTP